MRLEESLKIRAADLFLTLDQHDEVDWHVAVLLDRLRDTEYVGEDLPLVVSCSPSKDLPALDTRVKRRRIPQFNRIHRLHVVVPVDHHGGATFLVFVAPNHNRVSSRLV